MACLTQQAFNTEIFGVPCYRIVDLDRTGLASELPLLLQRPPVMIDAKVPAVRHETARWLRGMGFRSVCTQIALHCDLTAVPAFSPSVTVGSRLALDDATISAHAANFTGDRYSLDPAIDRTHHDALYRQWIRNSISGRMLVASQGRNFCSFREQDAQITIDLLSVLDKRQGIGRQLVNATLGYAARQHDSVRVVTECGNEVAWRLYLSCGFRIDGFTDCLHFVST